MDIEAKIKELEAIADKLEKALEEKDLKIKKLTMMNEVFKAEIESLRDVIYFQAKNKSR